MSDQYFHFTLGPVQGFVAQARRTRDFWAGSFLLSYLSAVAIKAVEKQDGDLIFPTVEESYLDWLENKKNGTPPQQGCIPNRFKGGTARVKDGFDPTIIEKSIKETWQGLAKKVWERDLQQCDEKTKAIWDRQVSEFWEMSWVITDEEKQSNLLDRRKNWRSYMPPKEQGVKCMMMDGWQELSGIETPHAEGLSQFWDKLRNSSDSLSNDLREGEYLCAIAFIKRRFSHVFKNFKQELSGNWTAHGWQVNPSVPSVSYMAAAPWMAKIIEHAPNDALKTFNESANKLLGSYGKTTTKIACLRNAIKEERNGTDEFQNFINLEGDVFFESLLDNIINDPKQDKQQAQQVKKDLTALITSVNMQLKPDEKLTSVSPFYAVLMMDGDSLGIQMSDLDKQEAISLCLNLFTQGVAKIVEQYNGFLIYAGGDDVLALLPLEDALNCAKALREHYLDSFEKKGEYHKKTSGHVRSTLSGAIEYAHIKMPLGKVLADAHHLLDNVAKDEYGRDSIAIRVWKPGGQHLQWAMPWKYALNDNNEMVLDKLAKEFRKTEKKTAFSSTFFFNIETRFAMLQSKEKGQWKLADGFKEENIKTLISAEYLNSGVNKNRKPKLTLKQAEEQIAPLIQQCLPKKRSVDENKNESFKELHHLNIDGAHLVRFLANKGVDHG